ncbi:hypothetical protein P4133_06905 [Pseudomonas aeruginosa]|nr:hypothetical protein [Pseudomonas aeruginosa]
MAIRGSNTRTSSATPTSAAKAPARAATTTIRWPIAAAGTLWSAALDDACVRIAGYAPDALVISLGVDTYKEDPISQFRLDSPDYLRMGERIARLGLPTLFIMEGGYAVEAIGINAVNVLQGYEGAAR